MNQERFVKSYPSYIGSPIWNDDGLFKLYHYCLYKSSHNTYKWHNRMINPGELPISVKGASVELGWSINKLRLKLGELQRCGYITVMAYSSGTLIRVLGWFNHQNGTAAAERVPSAAWENTPISKTDTRINYQNTGVSETDTQCVSNGYGSVSETDNNQYKRKNTQYNSSEESEGFLELWLSYPVDRRTHREAAAEEYSKAIENGATPEYIRAALEADKQSSAWNTESGKFVPGIVKWLQKERWRDFVVKPKTREDELWTTKW